MNNSEKEIKEKVLNMLLDKYENSATYLNTNKVNQSFYITPDKVYPQYSIRTTDIDDITLFNKWIYDLQDLKFILVKKSYEDISKITLNTNHVKDCYSYVGRTERKELIQSQFMLLKKYQSVSVITDQYISDNIKILNKGKTIGLSDEVLENVLKLLNFITMNEAEILERELSNLILYDSKKFTDNYKNRIFTILKKYNDMEELEQIAENDAELKSMLLAKYYILQNPSYIYLKGNGYMIIDGQKIRFTKHFSPAISMETIDNIESINIDGDILTIENLTSFTRIKDNRFCIFLSGYHNRLKQKFIKKVALDNPSSKWYHFGDIDPDGLFIFNNLKEKTGLDFEMEKMNINELETHKKYCKKLEKNDITKANNLLNYPEYSELANYMLRNNCKLEQEIISLLEMDKTC